MTTLQNTPWGTSIIFEVSSAAPTADPVWVDLSSRVLTGLDIAEGRQSELDDVDPAVFSVRLRNNDGWLTPGNPSSPYVGWWKQGRRCRFREIAGPLGFDLFDGFLEIPENTVGMQEPAGADSDITMTLTGVDLVGRHRNSRKMVSTLGEHIVYNGGASLVAYWPLGESDGPDVNTAAGEQWTLTATKRHNSFASAPFAGTPEINFGASGIAIADDLTAVEFSPTSVSVPASDYADSVMLTGKRATAVSYGAGQAVTVAGWTRPGTLLAGAAVLTLIEVSLYDSTGVVVAYAGVNINSSGQFVGYARGPLNDWTGSVTGPPACSGQPIPVAVRTSFSPAVLELWVRDKVYSGTLTVSFATPTSFDRFDIGERYPGTVNHAQVYIGAPSAWTNTNFVAQYQMGLYGLERQSTGQRIATIADYAGIPAAARDVDPGTSVMQAASLAGKTAAAAWDEARDTEQGRLFAHAGRLVFHDRARIYNV